jgi:hypothetical protein
VEQIQRECSLPLFFLPFTPNKFSCKYLRHKEQPGGGEGQVALGTPPQSYITSGMATAPPQGWDALVAELGMRGMASMQPSPSLPTQECPGQAGHHPRCHQ